MQVILSSISFLNIYKNIIKIAVMTPRIVEASQLMYHKAKNLGIQQTGEDTSRFRENLRDLNSWFLLKLRGSKKTFIPGELVFFFGLFWGLVLR